MSELRGLKPPVKGSDKVAVSIEIEKIYHQCNETTYMAACVKFAEDYDYDIESVPKLISPTLKDKIHSEALESNLLKNESHSKTNLSSWC